MEPFDEIILKLWNTDRLGFISLMALFFLIGMLFCILFLAAGEYFFIPSLRLKAKAREKAKRAKKRAERAKIVYPLISIEPMQNPFPSTLKGFFDKYIEVKAQVALTIITLSVAIIFGIPDIIFNWNNDCLQSLLVIFLLGTFLCAMVFCVGNTRNGNSSLGEYIDYRKSKKNPRYAMMELRKFTIYFNKCEVFIRGKCGQTLSTPYAELYDLVTNEHFLSSLIKYRPLTPSKPPIVKIQESKTDAEILNEALHDEGEP